jgi:pectate lyase
VSQAVAQGAVLPVFPGAQGFGVDTPAGRGGVILRVTNLNDRGEGSLREAIAYPGTRIIVFEVAGVILLSSDLVVNHPFVTIAGQTAPTPGITLRGAGMRVVTHDVLLRHIRIRVGDAPGGPSPSNRDGLQILGSNAHHVVIDHVSVSWAIDENVSLWEGSHDITFSYCLISFALDHSLHPKGPHSTGLLVGDGSRRIALIRNVFAYNASRNPRIKGGCSVIVVNNLACNGRGFMSVGSPSGPTSVSALGNVYIAGVDTRDDSDPVRVEDNAARGTGVYLRDNWYHGRIYAPHGRRWLYTAPVWAPGITVLPHARVVKLLTRNGGARPADRDMVDKAALIPLCGLIHKIIDKPEDLGVLPMIPAVQKKFVTLDRPHDDDDGDGYSRVEDVLNQMACQVETIQCVGVEP